MMMMMMTISYGYGGALQWMCWCENFGSPRKGASLHKNTQIKV